MDEIFDIRNAFEILQGESPEGKVIFHVVDEKTGLLKKAGDMVVRSTDGKTDITITCNSSEKTEYDAIYFWDRIK